MFSNDEIDEVLKDAQQAVETLAEDVGELVKADAAPPDRNRSSTPRPSTGGSGSTPALPVPGRIRRILQVEVPLRVRLAERSMSIDKIVQFGPGSILEFERTVDRDLDLMINNCRIGRGVAVKVNEHFGLRITSIGDVQARIGSLGAG